MNMWKSGKSSKKECRQNMQAKFSLIFQQIRRIQLKVEAVSRQFVGKFVGKSNPLISYITSILPTNNKKYDIHIRE